MTAVQPGPAAPRAFRAPLAVALWWVWVAFAAANLIDLAVQGRDRASLLAALGLLVITGMCYAAALRPRVVAGPEGLTIVNPLRDHQVAWAAVTGIEAAELLRVRCQWAGGRRAFYAWAVHASRRRRAARQAGAVRRPAALGGLGGFPAPGAAGLRSGSSAAPLPPGLDAEQVVTDLTALARAGGARLRDADDEPGELAARDLPATGPASRWQWAPLAAIAVPAVALAIVAVA